MFSYISVKNNKKFNFYYLINFLIVVFKILKNKMLNMVPFALMRYSFINLNDS